MSRSLITCPQCKRPLAEKHRSGYIEVIVMAIKAQRLHQYGSEVHCRACGEKVFIRQNHEPRDAVDEQRAA